MQWNYRQIIAVALVIVGVIGIYKARDYAEEIFSAKQKIEKVTYPFADNPFGGAVKRKMMREASQYDDDVQMLFYGSVAAIITGVLLFAFSKKASKKR